MMFLPSITGKSAIPSVKKIKREIKEVFHKCAAIAAGLGLF